jgi:hypothetical protein
LQRSDAETAKVVNELATKLAKLPGAEAQSEWDHEGSPGGEASASQADAATAGLAARVRLMMLISGLTTVIAIAAVISVIGYRIYHAGGNAGGSVAESIVVLPKGARVISTAVAGERIVVTLDIGGTTEIRIFDLKTLKETGLMRFATEP